MAQHRGISELSGVGHSRIGRAKKGHGMLTREEIEKEAEKFFVWDGERNDLVTFTSAKLFAYHCAVLSDLEANLKRKQKTPNR